LVVDVCWEGGEYVPLVPDYLSTYLAAREPEGRRKQDYQDLTYYSFKRKVSTRTVLSVGASRVDCFDFDYQLVAIWRYIVGV